MFAAPQFSINYCWEILLEVSMFPQNLGSKQSALWGNGKCFFFRGSQRNKRKIVRYWCSNSFNSCTGWQWIPVCRKPYGCLYPAGWYNTLLPANVGLWLHDHGTQLKAWAQYWSHYSIRDEKLCWKGTFIYLNIKYFRKRWAPGIWICCEKTEGKKFSKFVFHWFSVVLIFRVIMTQSYNWELL